MKIDWKEEKIDILQQCHDENIFIVGGFLFGAGMTVSFMAMEFLVALIFGHLAQFPELFMETPWWAIFLFCAVSYGGIMGLITILAKRK